MIALRDLLTRMQSQATGCVALLLVDLQTGSVTESCNDDATTDAGTAAAVMRDLMAPQHVVLPQTSAPGVSDEAILLSEDRTYVCRRLDEPPNHAVVAVCRGTRSLGLVAGLLHHEVAPKDGR